MNPHFPPDSSASPRFDILTGAKNVEDALKTIAAQRTKMSAAELGTMAGIGVLDQIRLAKAETNIRWWKDPALALSSFYALLAVGVPALGFGAGVAIDVAIFGGAFIELLEHYPLVETAPLVDIYLTRNRECGRFGNFLLGIQTQEGYHLVHHRFPHVPRWRLREVHQILLEDSEYAALHQVKGWTRTLRQLFAIIPA